ncbi:adenosine deaminase family protein [Cryptosporangium phraense]|uniref:Adenosine deaminase n=1 Tax=Cryptosporangium phraense TaxID=2593070 RepID=A0A545AX13_9ACTN|nr:adenosine deaminase [Cryptosporangium phraense]TQS45873.1 adenosine deaminase [Cryptosporangium phraense]
MTDVLDYVAVMPKVELHCHLEGSVPAATAIRLAARNGVALPTDDPDQLYRFGSLEQFLDLYVAVSAALAGPDDLAQAVYDSLADAARGSHLRYREFAFNPTNHPGVKLADMLPAMADAARSAESEFGVVTRFLVAINREQPPEVALELVRSVVALEHPYVVGIGLDHNELAGPPALFADAFALAGAAGLGRTAHAGERGNATEVRETIELLGVDRIDHGYAVLGEPQLVSESIAAGVHFASCWTTSSFHSAGRSPIPDMVAAGLPVSVSSDDPPMFGTDIGREHAAAAAGLAWSPADARAFVLRAAAAAFGPDDLAGRLEAEFDAL